MIFPRELTLSLATYLVRNKLRRRGRFPLVLMLEPTLHCNLSCAGCGRIRESKDIRDRILSGEECINAASETGAPVISITGGEPLLHPDIGQIVEGIVARKRFVYLCTNGLLLADSLGKFKPSSYLGFTLHLDGLAESHDRFTGRKGVFETATSGMKAAKQAGFHVYTNTTIFKGTNLEETEKLFALLSQIPVDGMMVSPAFSYEAVDSDVFLCRQEIRDIFKQIDRLRNRFRFFNTPVYQDFLVGKRELQCWPWSNPTRNPGGWKRPCYFINDGYCQSFQELMEETSWGKYGNGNDPRCANCMAHYGFEAGAIDEITKSPSSMWRTVRWNFFNS